MTKTYELPNDKMIMADVDEKHHTATVSVYILDDLVEAVNKTGHWIEHPTEEDYSVCSRCGIGSRRMEHGKNADGTKYIDIYSYRFCPYCGCRMVEPQESEE